MYLSKHTRKVKDKTYTSYCLRHSYRDPNGKVKHKHITNLYGRRIANNVQIFWALPVSVTFVLYYLISFFVVGLKGSLLWIKEGFVKES